MISHHDLDKTFLWWIDRNILTIKNSRIVNCGEVLREWLRGKIPGKTLFSCSSYTNKQSIPARLANHSGDSTKKQTNSRSDKPVDC